VSRAKVVDGESKPTPFASKFLAAVPGVRRRRHADLAHDVGNDARATPLIDASTTSASQHTEVDRVVLEVGDKTARSAA
jgi:hypothetical protein